MEKYVTYLMFPVIKQNVDSFLTTFIKAPWNWFALILLFSVFVRLKHH